MPASPKSSTPACSSSGRTSRRSRRRRPRYLGVPRDGRRRERHGRARARHSTAGDRPRGRGHLPRVHVLRDGRGDRAARRHAGLRRHRPGDAEPRPGGRRARGSRRATKAIMPVHLFGRPAPLDEFAALGVPIIEDAAQAFGAPRHRDAPASRRPSASSRRRTSSASATAASARHRHELAERVRMLALPRLQGQEDVRVRRLQLAPRRAPGGGAAALPRRSSTTGTRQRREAAARYAELGLGELVRAARRRAGPRVPHVRRADARARAPRRRAAARPRSRRASYYVVAAASAAGAALPRLGRRLAPGDGGAAADNLALPLWAGIAPEIQERVVETIRQASRVGVG